MSRPKGSSRSANLEEAAALRERALLMLAAYEREEPGPTWAKFRELIEGCRRLSDLRTMLRECRGMMAALTPDSRGALERELRDRFGADREGDRELTTVAKVRARGRIQSEREYRSVQAYQDAMAADVERQDEFLALGALLDDFTLRRAPRAREAGSC